MKDGAMGLSSFEYGKKKIDFFTISGEVIGTERHSETIVTGSGGGGGGFVAEGYGLSSNSNISINSKTVTSRDFWIKTDDGKEKHYNFGTDFPLRTGQKVSIVCSKSDKGAAYSIMINHNAKTVHKLANFKEIDQVIRAAPAIGNMVVVAIAMLYGLTLLINKYLAFWDDRYGEAFGWACVPTVIFLVYVLNKREKFSKCFEKHLKEVSTEVLEAAR